MKIRMEHNCRTAFTTSTIQKFLTTNNTPTRPIYHRKNFSSTFTGFKINFRRLRSISITSRGENGCDNDISIGDTAFVRPQIKYDMRTRPIL